jgi:hypothetical protein
MPMETGLFVGIGIAIVVVIGIVLLARAGKRNNQQLQAFLHSRGLHVARASPLQAAGGYRGCQASLEQLQHHGHAGRSLSTRMVLTGTGNVQTALRQVNPVGEHVSGDPAGMRQVSSGDHEFDARFRAFAFDPRGEAVWRDPGMRARILGFRRRGLPGSLLELDLVNGQARIMLAGWTSSPEEIQAVVDLGVDLIAAAR